MPNGSDAGTPALRRLSVSIRPIPEVLNPSRYGLERIDENDRRETRLRIGGPDGPGGVASLIPTLLSDEISEKSG
jgi:hypothetical protein